MTGTRTKFIHRLQLFSVLDVSEGYLILASRFLFTSSELQRKDWNYINTLVNPGEFGNTLMWTETALWKTSWIYTYLGEIWTYLYA